jgi:transcription initiation factor IIE alpha subunit
MFKIIDFERKAKDFCLKCFIDILKIVRKFTASSKCVMNMIFHEKQKIYEENTACEIYSVQKTFKRLFDALEEARNEHYSKIRTSLGHPGTK